MMFVFILNRFIFTPPQLTLLDNVLRKTIILMEGLSKRKKESESFLTNASPVKRTRTEELSEASGDLFFDSLKP